MLPPFLMWKWGLTAEEHTLRRRILRAWGGEGEEQGCLWAHPFSVLSDIVEILTLRAIPYPTLPVSSPKPFFPTPGTGRTGLRCALRSDRWGACSPHSSCLQASLALGLVWPSCVRAVVCDFLIVMFSILFSLQFLLDSLFQCLWMNLTQCWAGSLGGAWALGSPCSAGWVRGLCATPWHLQHRLILKFMPRQTFRIGHLEKKYLLSQHWFLFS